MSKHKYDKFEHFSELVSPDPLTNARRAGDLEKMEIVCPAGTPTHDMATYKSCFCRIEKNVISPTRDPLSFKKCTSTKYTECPVWLLKAKMEGREG